MSYDTFRADFSSRLLSILPDPDVLQQVLSALDRTSAGYDFTVKSTDLIVPDGLPDAVRLFMATKTIENLAKGSLDNYYSTIRHFFTSVRKPIDQVTAADVRLYLGWYKSTYGITDSTLDHKRIILNGFFEWCVDEDLLRRSPMRHVKPLRVADPERQPMTAIELETVRKSCSTLRQKALVDFLYSTAARISEVCALDIRHIDFTEHTVRIEHGKGNKGRTTFLNAEAEISLKAYLASRSDDCPALFVPVRGPARHVKRKTLEEEIARIVSRCDLSVKVTPHVFRHTAASLALQRGMPIDQVQKWLGHARIQTTLRYAKTLHVDVQLSHQKFVA